MAQCYCTIPLQDFISVLCMISATKYLNKIKYNFFPIFFKMRQIIINPLRLSIQFPFDFIATDYLFWCVLIKTPSLHWRCSILHLVVTNQSGTHPHWPLEADKKLSYEKQALIAFRQHCILRTPWLYNFIPN